MQALASPSCLFPSESGSRRPRRSPLAGAPGTCRRKCRDFGGPHGTCAFPLGNHSGTDLLDCEWRAADAAVGVLADRTIELNGDGLGAPADHCSWQAVEVAGANIVADANSVTDAEASQGVGQAGSLDGLDAVADGVVEEVELAVELAGGDQGDQGLDGVGWQPRVVVRSGISRA